MRTRLQRKKRKISSDPEVPEVQPVFKNGPTQGEKDAGVLLGIFPTEIWSMVLDNISDSTDLKHLTNSSLYFRDILLPQRIFFLFPSIWPVLRTRQSDYTSGAQSCQILKYRQVCSQWNSTIVQFYQQNPAHYSLKSEPLPDKFANQKFSTYVVTTDFRRCFDTQNNLNREALNPFLGRAITLDTTLLKTIHGSSLASALRDLRRIMFWLGLTPVLKKYGHHVWYCTVKGSAYNIVMMLRCLDDMPNLKVLNLQVTSPPKQMTPERATKLANKMEGSPIPHLANLKYLNVEGVPALIFNKILEQNGHITQLKIKGGSSEYGLFKGQLSLPNITRLSVDVANTQVFKKLLDTGSGWNLQELRVKLQSSGAMYFALFKGIEEVWGKTLTEVSLDFSKTVNCDETLIGRSFNFRWNLERVRELELRLEYQPCLDFLLPMCGTLERLKICGELNYGKGKGSTRQERFIARNQIIKIIGFVFKMHQSNVWAIFGRLRKLKLECDSTNFVYRRPLKLTSGLGEKACI